MPEVVKGSIAGNLVDTANSGSDTINSGIDTTISGVRKGVVFAKDTVKKGLESVGIVFPGGEPEVEREIGDDEAEMTKKVQTFNLLVRRYGLARESAWFPIFPADMFVNGYTYPGNAKNPNAIKYESITPTYAKSVTLPEIDLGTDTSARLSVNHSPHPLATGLKAQTFTIEFYDSSDGYLHSAMYRWASQYRTGIQESKLSGYSLTQGDIRSGFENYNNVNTGTGREIEIIRFNIHGKSTTRYRMIGVYPTRVTSPKLRYDADASVITFTVTFATVGMYPEVMSFDIERVMRLAPGSTEEQENFGGVSGLIKRLSAIYQVGRNVERGIRYGKRFKDNVAKSIENIKGAKNSNGSVLDKVGTVFGEGGRVFDSGGDIGRQVGGIFGNRR